MKRLSIVLFLLAVTAVNVMATERVYDPRRTSVETVNHAICEFSHPWPFGCDMHGAKVASTDGDRDGDGVMDSADKCPNTPRGAVVDAAGCALDSDGDGVPNGIDRCTTTLRGVSVDEFGCALDSDGDGIADGIDRCPDTPRGAKIDDLGCPSDGDGDGVYDGIDRCPNTPTGREVDAEGCPTTLTALEQEVVDTGKITARNVNFATGTADLTSESEAILDNIGKLLSDYPMAKVEVGGHTDDRGAQAFNQDLSEKRAKAVMDYLLNNFSKIKKDNLTARGYGEGTPVASNAGASGRAQNRRVEFVIVNLDELRN